MDRVSAILPRCELENLLTSMYLRLQRVKNLVRMCGHLFQGGVQFLYNI